MEPFRARYNRPGCHRHGQVCIVLENYGDGYYKVRWVESPAVSVVHAKEIGMSN
jgi:hypothetical protein